jgi:hypothetical protein
MIALAILFIILNAADWWTTRRLIESGGIERNPLMVPILDRFGFAGLAVVKVAMVVPVVWLSLTYNLWWALAPLCAVYSYVVWNNWRLA